MERGSFPTPSTPHVHTCSSVFLHTNRCPASWLQASQARDGGLSGPVAPPPSPPRSTWTTGEETSISGNRGSHLSTSPLRNVPPVPPAEELLDATLDWSGQTPIKALGKWLSPPSAGIGFYPHLEPWETREAKTRPGRQMPRRRVQSSHRVVGWESGDGEG